jgi:hypothetical protein
MQRVLVIARHVAMVREQYAAALAAAGVELVLAPGLGQVKTEAELLELLPGCMAVIAAGCLYRAARRADVEADRAVGRRL